MKKSFEIPVYNTEVREAIKNGKPHPSFENSWADTHLITVLAHTENEAIINCRRKHPEKMGFVFGKVVEVN
jgi:hypothetical protein